MQQQLRVLSVNDAREWLLPLREGQQQIQIAALKRLVLEQQQLAAGVSRQGVAQNGAHERKSKRRRRQQEQEDEEESKCERDDDDEQEEEEEDGGGGDSYVMFRGRILADMDFFNLNALAASDFFVFAQETAEQEDEETDPEHEPEEFEAEGRSPPRKRKRSSTATATEDDEKVQQLVAMGFAAAQVRDVLQQTDYDLAHAVAILTGDESAIDTSSANGNGILDASVRELVHRHPKLQVLQPVLSELQALSVQQVAASDVFQALMLLKENVSSGSLAQLNAHPSAAIEFFRLLPQSLSPVPGASSKRQMSELNGDTAAVIDLVNEPFTDDESHQNGNRTDDDSGDLGAIERVCIHCAYLLLLACAIAALTDSHAVEFRL